MACTINSRQIQSLESSANASAGGRLGLHAYSAERERERARSTHRSGRPVALKTMAPAPPAPTVVMPVVVPVAVPVTEPAAVVVGGAAAVAVRRAHSSAIPFECAAPTTATTQRPPPSSPFSERRPLSPATRAAARWHSNPRIRSRSWPITLVSTRWWWGRGKIETREHHAMEVIARSQKQKHRL